MEVLSKEEFLRRYLRDRKKRKEMENRKKEAEIIGYYARHHKRPNYEIDEEVI
ncbi:hypothetical protein [Isachenkonia alkalipeptolytica]|uniref:hypothetical protein n=1 Tax=Isachenkonia alkalipeptolytica TaxID=2565777 RepID=UPI001370C020|nr:hypothetical protein [Isachenkonia alkalipeptolytica]